MIKTVSRETTKLLKENGYPQNKSSFYIVDTGDNRQKGYPGYKPKWNIVDSNCASARRSNTKNDKFPDEQIAMPNTDELLEELPVTIKTKWGHYNTDVYLYMNIYRHPDKSKGFDVSYTPMFNPEANGWFNQRFLGELPEALAQMWLWLKKEGLI